ncbi:type IV pilus modification protein PilV [Bergeriella denitrificans]|uniref:Type IV pilus assembly protein PilV n=1 Tax=Bergeriella denitrificans TaxID=494 RepID=A0A378UHV3_BERDE|nr:type IV pilus modification protein PilV [Bergeriella denitrificans]STZ76740.1 type IV pilus assembly protein PilV [Bergeriella denitrificans]
MANPSGKAAAGRLKKRQQGVTLIEVLVASAILLIGVLALLSVQTRAVSGVREAEGESAVSLIVQNLSAGMAANPVLTAAGNSLPGKSFRHYYGSGRAAACRGDYAARMDKTQLAAAQLCRFQNSLAAALPESTVYYAVCRDTSGNEPTLNGGTFNPRCNNRAGMTAIKVAWLPGSDAEGGLRSADGQTYYTFQIRMAE